MQYFNILVHYPSLTGWTGTGPYVGAYVLPVLVFLSPPVGVQLKLHCYPASNERSARSRPLDHVAVTRNVPTLADPTPAALLRPCVSLGKIDDSISLPVPRRPHPDHNVPGSHAPMGMFVHSNRSLVCASSYFPFIYISYYLLTN